MYDYLITGCGFTGAVLAERLASQLGCSVMVIDQREHIGGNAYDYYDSNGILVHKYGAHIFHTNSQKIWEYISGFTAWNGYIHQVDALVDGRLVPLPVNLDSVEVLFEKNEAETINNALLNRYGREGKVAVLDLLESDDSVLRKAGEFIYEKIYFNYTLKQWELSPLELKKSVTSRLPVYTTRGRNYFRDRFQGLPAEGYTKLFERLLSRDKIDVATGMSFKEAETTVRFNKLIFTGAIDEYFDFIHGKLPYRSLRFENQYHEKPRFQSLGVINFPDKREYTRILEFKQLTLQKAEGTTITYEYPAKHIHGVNDPYYPIPARENDLIYSKYQKMTENLKNVIFAGRLADYTYYNMDQAVGRALSLFEKIASKNH